MNRTFCLFAVVATAFVISLPASAEVIFSDSFDRVEGFDADLTNMMNSSSWGDNDNSLGGAASQTYSMDTTRGGGAQNTVNGSAGVIKNGAVQINTDFGPLAPMGYTVAFDMTRTTGNGYLALAVGLDSTSQIPSTGGFNGNAFLFTNGGNGVDAAVVLRQTNGNATDGTLELWAGGSAALQTLDSFYTDREATQSVLVTVAAPNGYGAGSMGTLTAEIDGSSASQAITFDGVSSGYLSLFSNQTGATIDNLVVTAIPEPTTIGLTLFALIGCVAGTRRRA